MPGDQNAPLAIFNDEQHIIVIDTTLEENGEKKMFIFRLGANGVADKDFGVSTFPFSPIVSNQIQFYPNPIKNTSTLIYTLENPENLTIQLTNLNGQILKTYLQNQPQITGTYQQPIDLPSNLPQGMYLLRLSSPNGQTVIKVVK